MESQAVFLVAHIVLRVCTWGLGADWRYSNVLHWRLAWKLTDWISMDVCFVEMETVMKQAKNMNIFMNHHGILENYDNHQHDNHRHRHFAGSRADAQSSYRGQIRGFVSKDCRTMPTNLSFFWICLLNLKLSKVHEKIHVFFEIIPQDSWRKGIQKSQGGCRHLQTSQITSSW